MKISKNFKLTIWMTGIYVKLQIKKQKQKLDTKIKFDFRCQTCAKAKTITVAIKQICNSSYKAQLQISITTTTKYTHFFSGTTVKIASLTEFHWKLGRIVIASLQ